MKKLFVRFFNHLENQIPVDSHMVCVSNATSTEMSNCIISETVEINEWMKTHPQGKVDFVWL
jgi:hypothetical protein